MCGVSYRVHENFISVATMPAWTERDREGEKKEGSEQQNSIGRKQADKTAELEAYATLHKKERLTWRVEPWPPSVKL